MTFEMTWKAEKQAVKTKLAIQRHKIKSYKEVIKTSLLFIFYFVCIGAVPTIIRGLIDVL